MTARKRNILSGVTAVVGLAGLGWMILMFGQIPRWAEKTYPIYVDLDNTGGLAPGSRVTLNGIDVGYVDAVRLHDDPRQGVEITCRVRPDQLIPSHAVVGVSSGVFGGGASLAIRVDPTHEGPLENVAAGGRLAGSSVSLAERLEQRVNELSERVTMLADEYVQVGRNLNDMLAARRTADVDAGKAEPNLRTVIARVDASMAQLTAALTSVNELLGDQTLREDLAATLRNARSLTGKAEAGVVRLTDRYVAVADDLSKAVGQINELLAAARSEQGTVGKLLGDPKLYDTAQDAAARLGDALKELQLLIRKWKAEGLPVQF